MGGAKTPSIHYDILASHWEMYSAVKFWECFEQRQWLIYKHMCAMCKLLTAHVMYLQSSYRTPINQLLINATY